MRKDCNFYICPTCFETSETPRECHGQMMIHCAALPAGHEDLKPLFDEEGNLKTRAPAWFVEQVAALRKKNV